MALEDVAQAAAEHKVLLVVRPAPHERRQVIERSISRLSLVPLIHGHRTRAINATAPLLDHQCPANGPLLGRFHIPGHVLSLANACRIAPRNSGRSASPATVSWS